MQIMRILIVGRSLFQKSVSIEGSLEVSIVPVVLPGVIVISYGNVPAVLCEHYHLQIRLKRGRLVSSCFYIL